ncbi:hypothetical protein BGZ60DRAFT_415099 [Tricladium varicosporioides]|nr:hypothetical protein BGZ60DRAFT_415099 [Hymenoscyphus varicosporioides]
MFANNHGLSNGAKCTLNGFIGQLTVQGTDFSILLIAVATVTALRGKQPLFDTGIRSKALVLFCVWLVPITTSFTALGLNAYSPVSGNWCWISSSRPVLRYALNHGWRFLIIIITISLYIYLYFYFRSHFSEIRNLRRPSEHAITGPANLEMKHESEIGKDSFEDFKMRNEEEFMIKPFDPNDDTVPISSSKALTNITSYTTTITTSSSITPFSYQHEASLTRKQAEIQKVLLLNAYPIAYVILWLPGIVNRMVELSGNSSRVLFILQSASQYVGLANAITYGYNEGIKRQLSAWWERRRGR